MGTFGCRGRPHLVRPRTRRSTHHPRWRLARPWSIAPRPRCHRHVPPRDPGAGGRDSGAGSRSRS